MIARPFSGIGPRAGLKMSGCGLARDTSTRPMTKTPPSAVFLHAFWRTGSTWFWQKFRDLPDVCGFYEPYHYWLAEIKSEDINGISPSGWQSRHAPTAPYFDEYRDLLQSDGGVQGFDPRLSVECFFPRGQLEDTDAGYLQRLRHQAEGDGRTPVYGFCRSLGRAGAMREALGGHHITLLRDPLAMLNSTIQQQMLGDYLQVATCPQHRDILEQYGLRQPLEAVPETSDIHVWAQRRAVSSTRIALHLYLVGCFTGLLYSDLVVEIDRLESDPDYRQVIESHIQSQTGLAPDLSDCKVPKGYDHLEPSILDVDLAAADLENAFFSRPAEIARLIEDLQGVPALNDPAAEMNRLKVIFEQSVARFRDTNPELEGQTVRPGIAEHLELRFAATDEELERVTLKLAESERLVEQMRTSPSWRLTKPFRDLRRLFKGS